VSVVYNCCWSSPEQSFSGPKPAGLMTIFYCLRFENPKPGGPGPRIYIPQEQGGAVIPPVTAFPFRLLLRLAGPIWKYSNPPPHGVITSARNSQKTFLPLLRVLLLPGNVSIELFPSNGCCIVACLHSCYLEMAPHITLLWLTKAVPNFRRLDTGTTQQSLVFNPR
jgi:hypothetical protein